MMGTHHALLQVPAMWPDTPYSVLLCGVLRRPPLHLIPSHTFVWMYACVFRVQTDVLIMPWSYFVSEALRSSNPIMVKIRGLGGQD